MITMNKKLKNNITEFCNKVNEYIHMEYKPKYYRITTSDRNLLRLFDFVSGQYMGGNNVPDTAGLMIEYINKHMKDQI